MKRVGVVLSALVAVAVVLGLDSVRAAPGPDGKLRVELMLAPDGVSVSIRSERVTIRLGA